MESGSNYAWAVCASCCLLVFVCIGIVTNGFSIYLPYLHEIGLTNTETSVIVNIRAAVSLVLMFVIHLYYRHLSVRTGVIVAALFTFAAYLVYSVADGSFVLYAVGSAFTGVSYAFGAMIILSDVLRRWFHENFALAIGITAAGSGVATTVIPIYVDLAIGPLGLSGTFLFEAVIVLVLIAVAAFLFSKDPADKGTVPHGWKGGEYVPDEFVLENARAKMPLRIWLTLGIVSVVMGAIAGPCLVFLGDLFTTSGFSVEVAAASISAIGILMIIGKVAVGAAIDRLGTYKALTISGVLLTFGLLLTPFLGGSIVLLAVSVFLMGLGFSMMMLAPSNFARDVSDPGEYFMVVRNFEIAYVVGSALFSTLPGILADATGSYAIPYLIFGLMTLTAIGLMTVHYRVFAKRG